MKENYRTISFKNMYSKTSKQNTGKQILAKQKTTV